MDDHQRQAHTERRSRVTPAARGVNGPAVQFDEMPHDGEPEADAAVLARRAAVAPAESARRCAAGNPARCRCPLSLTTISTCEFTRSSRTCTTPSFGVNFTAFETRFQTICCRRSGSPEIGAARGSRIVCTRIRLASAAGQHGLDGVRDDARQIDRLNVQANLAGDDPRDVEDVARRSG